MVVVFTLITQRPFITLVSSTTFLTAVIAGLEDTAQTTYLLSMPSSFNILGFNESWTFYIERVLLGSLVVIGLVLVDSAIYMFIARRKINGISISVFGNLFLEN